MKADQIDDANDKAQEFVDSKVEEIRRRAAPERVPDENGDIDPDCIDCGEEIGADRLALGRARCFTCQSRKENRERMHGR